MGFFSPFCKRAIEAALGGVFYVVKALQSGLYEIGSKKRKI